MNNNVYPGTPIYTGNVTTPNQQNAPTYNYDIPLEQSYIENILRLNRGNKATIYMTFPDSIEWRDKKISGIIEQSGRDHIIVSNPTTGKWILLLMIYVDYIEFDEKIKYSQEFIPTN